MKSVLVIKSGALGAHSVTNSLVDFYADELAEGADCKVTVRDLAQDPLPHIDGTFLMAATSAERTPEQASLAAKADALIAELKAADTVVIGASMYNFGIPSTLKAYLDHVLRAGGTFKYGAHGPEGLVTGKKAILVVGTGGVYSAGPSAAADFVVPYMKTVLGFIGITDVTVVRAEGVAMGAEPRTAALAQAQATLKELA